MSNITFLEERQITGNDQLEILKKYGTKCAITDFSILLGGYVSSDYYTSEGTKMSDRTGWYWTRTDDGDNDARVVYFLVLVTLAMLTRVTVVVAQLYLTHQSNQSPRTE